MDAFKVRGQDEKTRNILLSFSFGSSSSALLHLLDQQLRTQLDKTGRQGYKLHVLHVEQPWHKPKLREHMAKIKQCYPSHEYHVHPLEEVFTREIDLPLEIRSLVASLAPQERMNGLLSSLSSLSSRADLIAILRFRLTVHIAESLVCQTVAWGDSATRLAERTLSEIANGRGASLTSLTQEGFTFQSVSSLFPMRDLLRKEVVSYATLSLPSLMLPLTNDTDPRTKSSVSARNTTINDLMGQFFESVEESYPSTVTNVVRTSGKLQVIPKSDSAKICQLCGSAVSQDRAFGEKEPTASNDVSRSRYEVASTLCYGCSHLLHDPKKDADTVLSKG